MVDVEALVEELPERYPDKSMPIGAGLALARDLRVSIAYVARARRIAGICLEPTPRRAYGWRKKGWAPPADVSTGSQRGRSESMP